MEFENYIMKEPNEQGYRILDGTNVHYCDDDKVVFEWALIDRGEGRTPCVGHWVSVERFGKWDWEMEGITWNYGHYFNTIEEAEVYYRERVMEEMENEIEDLKDRLAQERNRYREAKKLVPKEEDV